MKEVYVVNGVHGHKKEVHNVHGHIKEVQVVHGHIKEVHGYVLFEINISMSNNYLLDFIPVVYSLIYKPYILHIYI